jgi:hypothetical protein
MYSINCIVCTVQYAMIKCVGLQMQNNILGIVTFDACIQISLHSDPCCKPTAQSRVKLATPLPSLSLNQTLNHITVIPHTYAILF